MKLRPSSRREQAIHLAMQMQHLDGAPKPVTTRMVLKQAKKIAKFLKG